MKVLLMIANSKTTYKSPPLGLLYVSSALRQAGFGQIQIIDARVRGLSHKEISRQIKSFSPDVAGISALSIEGPEVHRLAGLLRQTQPRCKVVVGGAYATSSPEFIIKDPHIDFVVMGEGEKTMCSLMDALTNGKDVSGIDGLAFKNDGDLVINLPTKTIEDIDSLPFPAWDLIDMERYFHCKYRHSENSIPTSNRIFPLFTSRGCSFGCIYCHNIFGKRVRLRSVQNVIGEIELLVKRYNVGEIEIVDDIFNFDLARAKQICDEIIRRNIKINLSFPNALRVDRMDEELIVKLKQAGTRVIFYAIESGSPEVQKRIRKDLDLDKAKYIIHYTVRQGIVTGGYFMLGFPEETKDQMLATIRFAKELPFHLADFFYVTPRPHTPLFEELKSKHAGLEKAVIHQYHILSFNASAVSDAELEKVWSRAYREFYLRPLQIWRIWKAVPNKKMLLRNFAIFLLKYVLRAGIIRR